MQKPKRLLFLGILLVIIFFLINISFGSAAIPFEEVLKILCFQAEDSVEKYIVLSYRLPKAITAILVGSGLALSGLLMQTLFRNPLAGPYVLGLSSGASLGVALVILGSQFLSGLLTINLFNNTSIIIASSLGSFLVLLAVLGVARRVRDTMAILIIGLMFASFTAAAVSILSYFSDAEKLQQYIFWSFGSLGDLTWEEVIWLGFSWFIGLSLSLLTIKPLNALLLGEAYAQSVGTQIKKNRYLVILATSILAGSITAFAGPIAFIGLAVPHLARLIIKQSNHAFLFPACIILGSLLMLISDLIAQMPSFQFTLPINAVTSLFGAPVVIWLLVRKKKMSF